MPFRTYRRNLPHIFPERVPIFFTWRLHGSVPALGKPADTSRLESAGEKFKRFDQMLDGASSGPTWMKNPRVATVVAKEIERADECFGRYTLLEYVVMPNHVHLLVLPHHEPRMFMKMLKGMTARRANRILRRASLPFWQDESFDHWCRSIAEVRRIRRYITENPVKCGLVHRAEDWPWSSAHRRLVRKQEKLVQRVVP